MDNNNKIALLKNLFSSLIENFEASYVIDGNMENLKRAGYRWALKNPEMTQDLF